MPTEAFRKLLELERTLRGPGGCPWDAQQTIETLKPNLLEETYEALEAHSSGDPEEFREELGDLFYVLVFIAKGRRQWPENPKRDRAIANPPARSALIRS